MDWLFLGLAMWCLVHFIPTLGVGIKQSLIAKMGNNGYRGVFSLLIVLSLVMIVAGWRSVTPEFLYALPMFTRPLAMLLILVAFIFFVAARLPTRLKQYVRNPQLTSVILWAIAHLVLNGDTRAVMLFGTLGVWAILEIVFINKRDGEWVKPPVPGWGAEVKVVMIGFVAYVAVMFLHPYIAGVPVHG